MHGFKDHFSALAAQYAQFRPKYPDSLFDYLAGLCRQRGVVWDCACGSGQATVSLARRFKRVIATDASAKQVAAAEPVSNVEYRVASAEQSGLADASTDLVTVAQSLHWFDVERFYTEARRVLKPGGVLAVWTYGDPSLESGAAEQRFASFRDDMQPYWPPERQLVVSGYRTLTLPFAEIEPPPFELREHWTLPQLLGYLSSWSAIARYVSQRGMDPVEALGRDLESTWGNPQESKVVTWPLAMRVGRKP